MATRRWAGAAPRIAQVQTFAFAGTWEAADLVRASFSNGKVYDFTAGSTTTATVVSNLVAAWNALSETDYPEFAELTASANTTTLVLTADTAGLPFTVTLTPLESNAGAADDQTIEGGTGATTGTAATACSSPHHWSLAANWKEGAVPVTGDDVVIAEGPSIKYGLAQSAVTLATLKVLPSFLSSSEIGLPGNTNPTAPVSGYPEYRDTRLAVGATVAEIETQSPRIRLDLSAASTTVTVRDTGPPADPNDDALDLKATTTATVYVLKGYVGVNNQPGDAGTVADLNVAYRSSPSSDAKVRCGSGCTVTNLDMSGGDVTLANGATTVTKSDGTLALTAGAVTTLNNRGGDVLHDGAGTIATLNNLGRFYRRGFRAGTITSCNLYARSVLDDRSGTLTFTNPVQYVQCRAPAGPDDRGDDVAYLCVGSNRTITPG